ncbi:MAG: PEP-CTERM sorting domain-containing protein [Candidatus Auribacterota bacterium]
MKYSRLFATTLFLALCTLFSSTSFSAEWWDADYDYRQALDITTAGYGVSADYSTKVTLDLGSLVTDGKIRADYNDVRVLFHDGTTYTELDRHIRNGSSGSEIWFAMQEGQSANTTVTGKYYLYYGNTEATSAPTNYSNIYMMYDGFSGTSLSSNWHGSTSSYSVSNGSLVIPNTNGGGLVIYTDAYQHNSVREYSLKLTALSPGQLYVHTLADSTANNDWGSGNRVVHDVDPAGTVNNNIREAPLQFYWTHSTSQFEVFQDVFYNNTEWYYAGSSYESLALKSTDAPTNTIATRTFKINSQHTKQVWYMDYVLIRDYVPVEPSVTFMSEESNLIPEPVSIILLGISVLFLKIRRR